MDPFRRLVDWAATGVLQQLKFPEALPTSPTSQTATSRHYRVVQDAFSNAQNDMHFATSFYLAESRYWKRMDLVNYKDPKYPLLKMSNNPTRRRGQHPNARFFEIVAGPSTDLGTFPPYTGVDDVEVYRSAVLATLDQSGHYLLNSMNLDQRAFTEHLLMVVSLLAAYSNKAYAAWVLALQVLNFHRCLAAVHKISLHKVGAPVASERDAPCVTLPGAPLSPASFLYSLGITHPHQDTLGVMPRVLADADMRPSAIIDVLSQDKHGSWLSRLGGSGLPALEDEHWLSKADCRQRIRDHSEKYRVYRALAKELVSTGRCPNLRFDDDEWQVTDLLRYLPERNDDDDDDAGPSTAAPAAVSKHPEIKFPPQKRARFDDAECSRGTR